MSFSEIEHEVEALSDEEQRKLMARLVSLKFRRDDSWRQEVTRRLDDKSPSGWVVLEDVEHPDREAK